MRRTAGPAGTAAAVAAGVIVVLLLCVRVDIRWAAHGAAGSGNRTGVTVRLQIGGQPPSPAANSSGGALPTAAGLPPAPPVQPAAKALATALATAAGRGGGVAAAWARAQAVYAELRAAWAPLRTLDGGLRQPFDGLELTANGTSALLAKALDTEGLQTRCQMLPDSKTLQCSNAASTMCPGWIPVAMISLGKQSAQELRVSLVTAVVSSSQCLDVHIFGDPLAEWSALMSQFPVWRLPGLRVQMHDARHSFQNARELALTSAHYSAGAGLWKMSLPWEFAQMQTLVFLDTDTVVLGDLAELWAQRTEAPPSALWAFAEELSEWYKNVATGVTPSHGFNTGP